MSPSLLHDPFSYLDFFLRHLFIREADAGPQRKVKFPTEYDALDIVTDELRTQLAPVNEKLREVERERAERRKVRRRTKAAATAPKDSAAPKDVPTDAPAGGDVEMADAAPVAGAALEDEGVYRARELKELEALVSPELKRDVGCSVSGLYDLVGGSASLFIASAEG